MIINNSNDFYVSAKKITDALESFLESNDLSRYLRLDHVCYDCGSSESFERIRSFLEVKCDYLFQSFIAERRLAYIKLKQPIPTRINVIQFVELPDQKPAKTQSDKFDHVEAYPSGVSYEELIVLMERVGVRVFEKTRPHHTTHEVLFHPDFILRLTREPLIEKIRSLEFY